MVIEETLWDVLSGLAHSVGWVNAARLRGRKSAENAMEVLRFSGFQVELKLLSFSRSIVSSVADLRTLFLSVLRNACRSNTTSDFLLVYRTKECLRHYSYLESQERRQWKRAATPNGCPYAVGHTPMSPNPPQWARYQGVPARTLSLLSYFVGS